MHWAISAIIGPMPDASSAPSSPLLVACLCAAWCGTCNDYQPLFASLQKEFPQAQFRWVDIEDEADLVDPLDIENFPTLLIAHGGQARFNGTILPHLETLRRLIQNQMEEPHAAIGDADAHAVAQRLAATLPS